MRWRRDLNPRTVLAVSRFQGECIRPLCHATADKGSGTSSVAGMRAIVAESSDQLSWQDVPDVSAGPGEVLIKVAAAGVNRADVLQAAGKYPPPPGASEIIGMEVSGVVAETGSGVTDWSVGQQVCALLAGGGYAEHVAVPAGQVMPIPDGVDLRRRRRAAGSGLHGVVEPGADRPPGRGSAAAGARRRQRHRNPRDPGRARAGRPGGRHGRVGGEAGRSAASWAPKSPSITATRISSRGCATRPTAPT